MVKGQGMAYEVVYCIMCMFIHDCVSCELRPVDLFLELACEFSVDC